MGSFDQGFGGKVGLITGGASGIGLATARSLAELGARIIVADVDTAAGEAAAKEIDGEFARLDVAEASDWTRTIDDLMDRHGGIDFAYLNAGITTYPATGESLMSHFDIAALPEENYRRILGVNLDGVILGARAVTPAIRKRGGGAIVATASVAGVIAFPPDPIYTTTKHAVVGFMRSLAPLLEPEGITVNTVLPGVVDTQILAPGWADEARGLGIPVIPPTKIAQAVVRALEEGTTGRLWICLGDQDPYHYEFAGPTGLVLPDTN